MVIINYVKHRVRPRCRIYGIKLTQSNEVSLADNALAYKHMLSHSKGATLSILIASIPELVLLASATTYIMHT